MKNIDYKIENKQLIITIDLAKDFGASKSGKSIIVASTEGNKQIMPEGAEPIFLGLNLYKYQKS